jgi:ABC-type transport system involved in multi-copper enzyme maturation permease subunit
VIGGAVVLCAGFLTFEHVALASSYSQLGLAACGAANTGACMTNLNTFANNFGWLDYGIYWMLLLPAMVGVFVGAPLVARELENGTFRFVWMQSITRTRWFIAKVLALMAGCLLAAAALSATITWAMEPLTRVGGILQILTMNPLVPPLFDLSGIALLAATLLALSLGILAGTVTGRTVVAMFVTVLLFTMVRVPVTLARPHLTTPLATSAPVATSGARLTLPPGSLVLKEGFVDAQGQTYDLIGEATARCGSQLQNADALERCFRAIGLLSYAQFQPPNRYWLFQGLESSIYGGVSLVAIIVSLWIVRRRLA